MPGHLFALPHAAWPRTGTNRTRRTRTVCLPVRLVLPVEAMSLDDTSKAAPLGFADDVYMLPNRENVRLDALPNLILGRISDAKLAQYTQVLANRSEVTALGQVQLAGFNFLKAQLNR
jgi:hypothetical protein